MAQHRLLVSLHAPGGPSGCIGAAFTDAQSPLLRAGFAGFGKRVTVDILPPYLRGDTTVVPLRWVATGPLGDLFPVIDANLELDHPPAAPAG